MRNIKKLVWAIICVIAFTSFPAFAEEEASKITDICVFTGSLYYCDQDTGRVVFKSVAPVFETDKSKELAEAIEYLEVRAAEDALYLKDGTKAGYDWLNNYVDDKVRFIAARQADGTISILHFKFE